MAVEAPLQAASRPNAQPGSKIIQPLGALKGNQWAVGSVSGWWLGTFFLLPYFGNNNPN